MIFDVNYFDFDRNENTMNDGHHCSVDATDPAEAVGAFIRDCARYEEGTLGHRDYLAITDVEAEDEDVIVTAYRIDDNTWEQHVYSPDGSDTYTTFKA